MLEGLGDAVAVGEGNGVGDLVAVGDGVGDVVGIGVWEAVGSGVGEGVGVGDGVGVGEGVGVGDGVGVGTGPTFDIVIVVTPASPGPWNSRPSGPTIIRRVVPVPGSAEPFTY